ncbi:hypothetical protein QYE76_062550 [Lolium multiflorum]|uniref:DUF4219 domain-containing protein n=1 Tax=Lolium multiflorum TaxID=4521 RepID=A0AAD8S5F9_LOLMU|nr:hypothetical protein QYE76_062550 [Lolium multiflorum]
MLTKTNYQEWSLVMKVQMEAEGHWDVVNDLNGTNRDDHRALAYIQKGVSPELTRVLAVKDTAHDAWEALKTMRVGSERMREVKAGTLRTEYDNRRYRSGEGIESYIMRLSTIMTDLEVLGDPIDERNAVLKVLRTVPRPYKEMAQAIESLLDLNKYEEETSIARGGEEQLDVKMDVKLDMELDMKISYGRAREEREECARGEEEVQPVQRRSAGRHAGPQPVGRLPAANRRECIVRTENRKLVAARLNHDRTGRSTARRPDSDRTVPVSRPDLF